MGFSSRSYARPYIGLPGFPPGIKWLLISNVAVFLLQSFAGRALGPVFYYLALTPAEVVRHGAIWQLASYMFLHGGISHILWNMLTLWMFGSTLEMSMGTRRFLQLYFFSGVGAGVCIVVLNYLLGGAATSTIGSSGAIFGVILVCAVMWPDQIVLMSFLFPIKLKYMVMIIGGIAFLGAWNVNSGVSNIGHLGGMLFGYIFLKMPRTSVRSGRGFHPLASMQDSYKAWKLARAKKKFQVYLKKQRSDRIN
ncbi:MAG: rhomboid family intramembrane serine protease [Acidobacteriia bacterium]|nr:rhomboid family intramembrane serine protease [Terriglobia bacterium]